MEAIPDGITPEEAEAETETLSSMSDYTRETLESMDRFEKRALQRDINAVRAVQNPPLTMITVDGVVGGQTRGALQAIT